jgi:hypothetical protein
VTISYKCIYIYINQYKNIVLRIQELQYSGQQWSKEKTPLTITCHGMYLLSSSANRTACTHHSLLAASWSNLGQLGALVKRKHGMQHRNFGCTMLHLLFSTRFCCTVCTIWWWPKIDKHSCNEYWTMNHYETSCNYTIELNKHAETDGWSSIIIRIDQVISCTYSVLSGHSCHWSRYFHHFGWLLLHLAVSNLWTELPETLHQHGITSLQSDVPPHLIQLIRNPP